MGMFDYIHCEYELPSCPQALINRWGQSAKDIVFQTKNTPDQRMASYTITADGYLLANRKEYEWIDTPENVKEDATPVQALFNRGYNKVVREWTEQCLYFNGAVEFYDSYPHADKEAGDDYQQDMFAAGWVEYKALFQNGKLIQISQSEHTLPIKYTQQEIDERQALWEAAAEERRVRDHESRHKKPNPSQCLIDRIDALIIEEPPVFGIEDLTIKLSQIQQLINEYREKYDLHYKQP
jgi:hypothetical protein